MKVSKDLDVNIDYLKELLGPFIFGMMDVILRLPLPEKTLRPAALKPKDKDWQEE